MNISRTEWPEDGLTSLPNSLGACAGVGNEQPSFGITICWNEPKKLWKPCFVLDFWHWKLQIGWLY